MENILSGLLHVSLEEIPKFELRIPNNRGEGEDSTTPRICTSTSLENCITAMPGSGYPILAMLRFGLKPTLYTYRFSFSEMARIMMPSTLQSKNMVGDAEVTKEHWLLDIPSTIDTTVYQVEDADFEECKNISGCSVLVVKALYLSTPLVIESNLVKFLGRIPERKKKEAQDLIAKYGIRQIFWELAPYV